MAAVELLGKHAQRRKRCQDRGCQILCLQSEPAGASWEMKCELRTRAVTTWVNLYLVKRNKMWKVIDNIRQVIVGALKVRFACLPEDSPDRF